MFSLFKGSKAPKTKSSSKNHHCCSTKALAAWGGHSPDGGWKASFRRENSITKIRELAAADAAEDAAGDVVGDVVQSRAS
ncbi:hypothetical protein BDD12DRAFT_876268 [Trichophaea hybrida]|nr:hypothetical protein BDD12DRAFT_876268 [Trichophaea hybrida]